MYDELIAALRYCDGGECDGCCRYKKEHGTECYTLLRDAADAIEELTGFVQEAERDRDEYRERLDKANDAIEELQQTVKHYKGCSDDWYKEACDYKAMLPRWIPVTERLPEPKFAREWYLVALESGCVKSLAYEKEGRTDNLFRPGWHETASPVTHWMPLPEPPKEEE